MSNRYTDTVLLLLFAFLLGSFFPKLHAQIRTSVANGNWHNPATWSPVGIPGTSDTLVVVAHQVRSDSVLYSSGQSLHITSSGELIADTVVVSQSQARFLNEGLLHTMSYIMAEGTAENQGVIRADSLFGVTDGPFLNNGEILNWGFVDVDSSSVNTSNARIRTMLFNNLGTFQNDGYLYCDTTFYNMGNFINEGDVYAFNWINDGAVSGMNGHFCIEGLSSNLGSITGQVDICDNTPHPFPTNPYVDLNQGTIASTVTACLAGSVCGPLAREAGPTVLNSISVYPNPAVNQFSLEGQFPNLPFQLSLLDSQGKEVMQKEWQPGTCVSLEGIPAGLYLVRLSAEGYVPILFKLVKQKT